jgi:hypothetical protein
MEATTVRVADKLNERFNEALKMFEGHITARREEEQATRVHTNHLAPTKPTPTGGAAPKPSQSINHIDLRPEEGEVHSTGAVDAIADTPSSSRQ